MEEAQRRNQKQNHMQASSAPHNPFIVWCFMSALSCALFGLQNHKLEATTPLYSTEGFQQQNGKNIFYH